MQRSPLRHLVLVGLLLGWSRSPAGAGEVRGLVAMPDACAPLSSPAVVTLEPLAGSTTPGPVPDAAGIALKVRQQGLQFEPRVQVARLGQAIDFANLDREQHNVHSTTPGVTFSWSMTPNATQRYTPTQPGLIRLVCDVHTHMRGYVLVTTTPWAKVCKAGGPFVFRDVPAGRYVLNAWHEMGQPYRAEVAVTAEGTDFGTLTLQGPALAPASQSDVTVRAWPDVIDQIGVLLTEARELIAKPDGYEQARKRSEDAYYGEFEYSDMETAVRSHLGVDRAGDIEAQLRDYRSSLKAIHEGKEEPGQLRNRILKLMITLSQAAEDLKRLNIFDRRDIGKAAVVASTAETLGVDEQTRQLAALAASFDRIRSLADAGRHGEAASAMIDAYFTDFEPLERLLNTRNPQVVKPLEAQFNAIRGYANSGLSGTELTLRLERLRRDVDKAVTEANASLAGSFGPAFATSLMTILREGVEVILLLAMLIALAGKAGQSRAMASIWWGIGGAVLASLATAGALSFLVGSTQGRTREIVEGVVMLLATAILVYVSYWLISQTQAKRWAEFLKEQAAQGAKVGGLGTLALTSFLAVYREGAETTLMYQALISAQGGSRDGLSGIVAGLVLGLALLGVIVVVLRATSVRLPIRPFFKFTGFALYAMALIFVGNGVFELQCAGLIKVTPVAWIGLGVPALGIHPNVQTLVSQGFLLFAAMLALVLPRLEPPKASPPAKPVPARVGVGI